MDRNMMGIAVATGMSDHPDDDMNGTDEVESNDNGDFDE